MCLLVCSYMLLAEMFIQNIWLIKTCYLTKEQQILAITFFEFIEHLLNTFNELHDTFSVQ